MRLRTFAAIITVALLTSASPTANAGDHLVLAASKFTRGVEKWRCDLYPNRPYTPGWSNTGGPTGNGALDCAQGAGYSNYFFWYLAPGKFLGDKSAAYNGAISFHLYLSGSASDSDIYIFLRGRHRKLLRYTLPAALHQDVWAEVDAPIAAPDWKVQSDDHVASAAEIRHVLKHLHEIAIEFHDPGSTSSYHTRLDSVYLSRPR